MGDAAQASAIAAQIVTLFHTRFDPHLPASNDERAAREAEIASAIETALQAVESLDEDRILRHFLNAVQAAIRTNYFQLDRGGQPKDLIAIKFSSRKVDGMPLPRPLSRSSSIRRASRPCICASARWRAAASAGRTGRRISAPKFWAW